LVVSSKDPIVYKRWGMGLRRYGLVSEQWQERTVTII
jgi:hypothetical protein